MSTSRPYHPRSERHVWAFGLPKADVLPRDLANVLALAALDAARAARVSGNAAAATSANGATS